MTDEEKKRASLRIDSLNLVSIQHFELGNVPDILTVGRTLDLSEGGIKLEVPYALPLFSRLSLSIALKDNIIQTQGEVIFLAVQDDGHIHLGLRFLAMSEEDKKAIRNYLSANA